MKIFNQSYKAINKKVNFDVFGFLTIICVLNGHKFKIRKRKLMLHLAQKKKTTFSSLRDSFDNTNFTNVLLRFAPESNGEKMKYLRSVKHFRFY